MATEANDLMQRAQELATDARQVEVNLNMNLHDWLGQHLTKTLRFVKEALSNHSTRGGVTHHFSNILRELLKVTKKVKSLVHDCRYNGRQETEFIIAAIRLTDSAERFVLYHVELNWCRYLVEYMVKEDSAVKDLGCFDWNKKLTSVRDDSEFLRAMEDDRDHIVTRLKESLDKRGDHKRICKLLVFRFGDEVSLDGEPIPFLSDAELIGKGGQATVLQVKWKENIFAVKIFDNVDIEAFRKEANLLRTCSHPHILNMICSFEENRRGNIMMDRMSKDLHQHISDKQFNDLGRVDMMLQVAQGMLYLHGRNVVHRDLKPQNILLKLDPDDLIDPVLKVADFGLAKTRNSLSSLSDNTPNTGTTRYRAPELYQTRNQEGAGPSKVTVDSLKADVFSFAITCTWILTGLQPYGEDDKVKFSVLPNLVKQGKRPDLPSKCHPILTSLLQRCWDLTPSKRPSFADICEQLGLLKATLLTGADIPLPIFPEMPASRDECVRIVVIGKQKSGKASIMNQLPPSNRNSTDNSQRERWLSSRPVCLHDTKDLNDNGESLKEIKKFVGERNKRWSTKEIMKSYRHTVCDCSPDPLITRPVNRLHMVWFVCSLGSNLRNTIVWSKVTEELYDLPVQILFVGSNDNLQVDREYEKLLRLGSKLYPKLRSPDERNNENDEKLRRWIVKVDLTNGSDIERNLWAAFEAVQPEVEVKLPAELVLTIREELGPNGFLMGNVLSKSQSLTRSTDFVFTCLFDFWEVPSTLRVLIKGKLSKWVKQIKVNPREFVLACGLAAALVLYIKGRHPLGLLPNKFASNDELSKTAVDEFFHRHLHIGLEQSLRVYFVDAPKPSLWTLLKTYVGLGQLDEKHLAMFARILQEHFKLGSRDRDGVNVVQPELLCEN